MAGFSPENMDLATGGGNAERSDESPVPGPESAEEWRRCGEMCLEQRQYMAAADAFARAIQLNELDAVAHHHLGLALAGLGKHDEAVEFYKRALSLKPDYPEALNNMGRILLNRGKPVEAGVCFERAVQINPHFAIGLYNLGLVRLNLGRMDEATALFRQVLALQPDFPEALNNLGMVLHRQKAHEESIVCCMRALALRPNFPEALLNLGDALAACGREADAVEIYRRALSLKPDSIEALNNLGNILRDRGSLPEALECLERAVRLNPDVVESVNNLGLVRYRLGHLDEAGELFRRALALRPDSPEALSNLGNVLNDQGRVQEAEACFERAVEIDPNHASGLNNVGFIRYGQGRLNEAESLYRKALALQPAFPEALNNLGLVLRLQDELQESIDCYRKALALRPDYTDALMNLSSSLHDAGLTEEAVSVVERALSREGGSAGLHLNRGLFLLSLGRFEEGWREYEWRWKWRDLAPARGNFEQPLWNGEAAADRVLFLHAEQGFGDTIQFCRYAPLAAARGLRVVLAVPGALVELMRSLRGVERVMRMDEPMPRFHFHCPLMSLPLAFGTGLGTIPADIPYLSPREEAVLAWGRRVPGDCSGDLRVGLVWAGSARKHSPILDAIDRRRSISPQTLAPLLDVRGVKFYSLQKTGPSVPPEFGLIDLMGECSDFADTAALIANLDLVISVDTAIVHLAGALGKPVWVLNRYDSCWRWLKDRDDSPWYPTLRLFRQVRAGDWTSVIARVRADLELHAARSGGSVTE